MVAKTTDGGRPVETTAEDVLEVFENRGDKAEPLTAAEVADELGCSRRTALNRLHELGTNLEIASKKVGGRARVWWIRIPMTDGRFPYNLGVPTLEEDQEAAANPAKHQRPSSPDPIPAGDNSTTDESADALPADILEALAYLDTSHDRRAAVQACVEYLAQEETAQRSDFIDNVYPDAPGGYQSTGGWWNKIGKEYLKQVAKATDAIVPPAGEGAHTWRWVTPTDE